MSNPNTERDERVREKFHECPMCCYDRDCTQGNAGGPCLHCNDPLSAEVNAEGTDTIANDAATRMRDRCVARVKEYLRHAKNIDIAPLIDDLQSLTLEGEQEK